MQIPEGAEVKTILIWDMPEAEKLYRELTDYIAEVTKREAEKRCATPPREGFDRELERLVGPFRAIAVDLLIRHSRPGIYLTIPEVEK